MRKKERDYSQIKRDLPEKRQENERKRITASIDIDHTVFKKTAEEKLRLKLAKQGKDISAPVVARKKRGGKEWRLRRRLKIEGLSHEEIEKRVQTMR